MRRMNPQVDGFLRKATKWREEFVELRRIVLACGLDEEVKWRIPCYTSRNRNIVLLQGFKEYCALGFVNGALLKDTRGILVRPGKHTQAGRMIRFTGVREILVLEPTIKAYIREAVAAEQAGLKVKLKKKLDPIPEESQSKLNETPALNTAFQALTPGRQRAYVFYFSGAKKSETRAARVAKCMNRILHGKGLND